MTKREIAARIYLSGTKPNYRVIHNLPAEAIVCHVPSASIGNAIVRALRARALERRANG